MWLIGTPSLGACACLLALSTSSIAASPIIDDCKKLPLATVVKAPTLAQRIAAPPKAASAPASSATTAAVKPKPKKKTKKPAAILEPCPPIKPVTLFSFIPPPDALVPDVPMQPIAEPPPLLVMTVTPLVDELVDYALYPVVYYGGGYFGGGGRVDLSVPQIPAVPEPAEWALLLVGLAGIYWTWKKHGRA